MVAAVRGAADAAGGVEARTRGGDAAGVHGGDRRRVDYDDALLALAAKAGDADELLALDEALGRLDAEDPVKCRLVKLRFFAGRSIEEAADDLGISRATASRYWEYARAFLRQGMDDGASRSPVTPSRDPFRENP